MCARPFPPRQPGPLADGRQEVLAHFRARKRVERRQFRASPTRNASNSDTTWRGSPARPISSGTSSGASTETRRPHLSRCRRTAAAWARTCDSSRSCWSSGTRLSAARRTPREALGRPVAAAEPAGVDPSAPPAPSRLPQPYVQRLVVRGAGRVMCGPILLTAVVSQPRTVPGGARGTGLVAIVASSRLTKSSQFDGRVSVSGLANWPRACGSCRSCGGRERPHSFLGIRMDPCRIPTSFHLHSSWFPVRGTDSWARDFGTDYPARPSPSS